MTDSEKIKKLAEALDDLVYYLWLTDTLSEEDRLMVCRKLHEVMYG